MFLMLKSQRNKKQDINNCKNLPKLGYSIFQIKVLSTTETLFLNLEGV